MLRPHFFGTGSLRKTGTTMSTTFSRRSFLAGLGKSGALLAARPFLEIIGYAQVGGGPARAVIVQSRTRTDFDRRLFGAFLEHLGRSIYTGVYDPATRSGSGLDILRHESGGVGNPRDFGKPGGYEQVRIIGDKYYTRFSSTPRFPAGSSWESGRGSIAEALDLNGGQGWAPASGGSADPAVLLATVRRLGQVRLTGRSGTGAMALDTYRFRYDIAGSSSVKPHRLTGTIVVHHQSNLIARIIMQTTVTGAHPKIADGGQLTFRTMLSFSGYGVAVTVRPPTTISGSAG